MRKSIIYLFGIAAIIAAGVMFNACSKDDDDESKQEIVGVWTEIDGGWTVTIKEDGTGILDREHDRNTPFHWTIKGNKFTLSYDGESEVEVFTYTLSGDTLKLTTEDGETFTFTKGNSQNTPSQDESSGKAVDLGLSVKWANKNVGASKSEDYGYYFAWGETAPKTTYDFSTYTLCNGTSTTMTKYCTRSTYGKVDNKTTLELTDDAARANWGGTWRMPTIDELSELNTKCTWSWSTQNGVNGYLVTGPNGNCIFLPVAGYRDGTKISQVGSNGYYWSSSLNDPISYRAHYFFIDNDTRGARSGGGRCVGYSIRPVTK